VNSYEPVSAILDGVLLSSETAETLEAAHALTRSLAMDVRFASGSKGAQHPPSSSQSRNASQPGRPQRRLSEVLEEVGMEGMWKIDGDEGLSLGVNGTRLDNGGAGGAGLGMLQRRCAVLVGKVIELIII
jgi:hypothetical protein